MLDVAAPFRLDNRVAIVTGASAGLGARFARVLHAAGATVVITARRADRLDALASELGDRVIPVAADVAELAGCEQIAAAAERVDVLVNNAGIAVTLPAEDETLEDWRRVIDVNLNAVFMLSQLIGRRMIAQGAGSIVNIASVLGLVASAPITQTSYCASKGAVVNLTRELAVQWARKGVRVNAIAPGWFPSEMTAEMIADERATAYFARNCPMGRYGETQELDGVLLFLASDASTYCTGQTIAVDGGWTAR